MSELPESVEAGTEEAERPASLVTFAGNDLKLLRELRDTALELGNPPRDVVRVSRSRRLWIHGCRYHSPSVRDTEARPGRGDEGGQCAEGEDGRDDAAA